MNHSELSAELADERDGAGASAPLPPLRKGVLQMKKFLSLLLCLILLFGLLPMTAPARADSSGDWEYEIDGGKATITKYNGAGGEVTIPSALGGKPVTVIGDRVFSRCTALTSITIPKSVAEIGYYAFSGCT